MDEDGGVDAPAEEESTTTGRAVTVIFSDDTGNLEVWVDDGESVGHVKEKVSDLEATLILDPTSAPRFNGLTAPPYPCRTTAYRRYFATAVVAQP